MKKIFTLALLLVIISPVTAQKKTKLNRGSDLVKALVTDPEEVALEIAVGEIVEQQVTEWVLRNREISHGDQIDISFLAMAKSERGQGTNILMRIKQNQNPSEVLMLVLPEENNTPPRMMYISRQWITQTLQVILDIACNDDTYLGATTNGFNLKFTKKETVKNNDISYDRVQSDVDLDVTLTKLKKWNGTKLVFEDADAGEAKVNLVNWGLVGSGDRHIFGYHPDGKFIIDYTEQSVRIWDKENQMYFTLPLVEVIRTLFQE